jgi:hypothetical protein
MEAFYGETGVMERPCTVARGKDVNKSPLLVLASTLVLLGPFLWVV